MRSKKKFKEKNKNCDKFIPAKLNQAIKKGRALSYVLLIFAPMYLCITGRLEGKKLSKQLSYTRFFIEFEIPAFFPCETGGTKAREISKPCKNRAHASLYNIFPSSSCITMVTFYLSTYV